MKERSANQPRRDGTRTTRAKREAIDRRALRKLKASQRLSR
jgi:hypothetical protein